MTFAVGADNPNCRARHALATRFCCRHRENIGWFLESLEAFGVSGSDYFMTNDLYEDANMKQVLFCLLSLKRKVEQG